MNPRHRIPSIVVALAVLLFVVVTSASAAPAESGGRKIVTLKPGASPAAAAKRLSAGRATFVKDLSLADAIVVEVPDALAARAIALDPAVLKVEEDARVHTLGKPAKAQPAEVLPWGIQRIGADSAWSITTGDPVKVAVVDTGIDPTHADLAASLKGGMSAVAYTTSFKDDNGHGSHVAGTIGAIDNTIGVVGVAPNVDLYAVKVLDRRGYGYLSDIIEGLDWCIANDIQVVNMSLGTASYSSAFDLAVQRVAAAGIVQVCAAGNSGPGAGSVEYPGRFPQTIAVAAVDSNNTVASFSSRGTEVDVAAPGVSVYSTYKNGGYSTLSGTSMATPHVTGTVALMLTTAPGAYDTDLDGWDPAEVQAKLQATAQDLGPAGPDTSYGYGLARADLAVAP